jgi:hypothetical protein
VSFCFSITQLPNYPFTKSEVFAFPRSWLFSASPRLRGEFLFFNYPITKSPIYQSSNALAVGFSRSVLSV